MIETTALRRKLLDLAISGKLVPKQGEWKTVPVGAVAEVELGKRVCKKTDAGIPYKFLGNINVRWGSFDLTTLKETFFNEKEAEQFSLKNGDLLICEGGVPGRCAIWEADETDIKYQMALHRVRPHHELLAAFLRYYLEAVHRRQLFTKHFIGCTIAHLTKEILLKLPIPLPPLAEQKAIVKRLEELLALEREIAADSAALDDLITAAKRKILDLAISGKLVPKTGEPSSPTGSAAPGWKMVKLGDACDVQLGKMLDRGKNSGKPYRYLANVNVRWGSFDLSDLKETLFTESDVEKFSLRKGDLLMCEGGVPGRCAIWHGEGSDIKFQKALHRVRPGACVMPEFLQVFFEAIHDRPAFTRKFTGSTIHHLPREVLVNVEIPLPPLAEQKAIVKRVEELFAVLDAMKGV